MVFLFPLISLRACLAPVAAILVGVSGMAVAAPFRPVNAGQMRTDFQSNWAGVSTVHGTNLPQGFSDAPTTLSPQRIALYTTSARIWNAPGRNQPGVLLDNQGPDPVHLYPDRYVQGAAVTIESTQAGPATFRIGIYLADGNYVAEKSVSVPDGRVPTFLGIIDPETRIGIITVSSGDNRFTISNLSVQDKKVINIDADELPVASQSTSVVEPMFTYLHQGYGNPLADEASSKATLTNENTVDLTALFPTMRPGDVLALERLGSPVGGGNMTPNAVIGVLSTSQELLSGLEQHRVPGAIEAGIGVYTPPKSGRSGIVTSTNIQEDFIISDRSLVIVPANAHYLFLSRAMQNPESTPVSVRMSHIPRQVFEAWVSDNGMAGTLALPTSDLDGDGLTLLEEFAFGKDPTTSDSAEISDFSFPPKIDDTLGRSGVLGFRFGGRTDGPIRYTPQVSSDLKTWRTLPASAMNAIVSDPQVGRSVFGVLDSNSAPKNFGRIVLDYIPPSN